MDWNKISEKQKREISKKKAIFICGPREMSEERILQLTKQLSTKKTLIFGCLKDSYINGFEGSEQFKTLSKSALLSGIENASGDVEILEYFQRDWKHILNEIDFSAIILVNGSWHRMLHLKEEFWIIVNKKTPYKSVSPFVDEKEAKEYAKTYDVGRMTLDEKHKLYDAGKKYTDGQIMKIVDEVAKLSFATDFQTSCALVKGGKILITEYNHVVPYETYALHHGSVKEKNFSQPNDLNHYDANHAEVEMLIRSSEQRIDLEGTSLYINLLPCPTCARMISKTKIKEIVYKHDHSDGYAYKMLTESRKQVRRIV